MRKGAGGLAIASHDLREKTGASVDIHVTYQSSAKEGDEVEIEGIAEKVGGSLAFTKVNIYRVEDDERGRPVARLAYKVCASTMTVRLRHHDSL